MCLHDLSELFCPAPLRVGTPVTSIRETILADSKILLSKSPNKHSRLYMNAQPLRDDLTNAIENRTTINSKMEPRILARTLVEQFNWEQIDARKVWCFGPEQTGPNLLVDMTKAVQYLNEIKDSVTSAFQWIMKEGPLCDEPVRGVRINIRDVLMNCDAIHRGGGQIIPAARRCFCGCILSATPAIAEPVYLMELQCRTANLGAVYSIIMRRRGQVIWEDHRPGWETITTVRAHIPVMESFGLPSELRSCNCGTETAARRADDGSEGGGDKAAIVGGSSCEIVTMVIDHWAVMTGDPHDTTTRCGAVVSRVRSHKCLPPSIPNVDTFIDKL
ncbi:elongation factor 2 [Pelomyxa schiedti]|nr:elongation factor 2 [Pelomyxa schiedti]